MKAEQVDALGAPMPWEADPELQEMTPTELKSILGDDLTPREKAKLNEMCVQELEKELKAKISAETSHIWQISSLTKELEKNRIKLNHLLQEQKPLAPKVSPIIAPKVASRYHSCNIKFWSNICLPINTYTTCKAFQKHTLEERNVLKISIYHFYQA